MAPSKENSKAAAGRARKEEAADGKKKAAQKVQDAKEDAEWSVGAKGKNPKEDKAASAEAARLRKAEAARLLAEEEAALPSKPKAASTSKAAKPKPAKAAPSAAAKIPSFDINDNDKDAEPTAFAASGIDDALDLLTLVSAKTDKASVGAKASQIEQHPERRVKAAFEAYKEENLAQCKKDYPGLRLQQYHDRLWKDFQKSEANPMNQASLAYNATKDDKVSALQKARAETSERLRAD